MAPKKKTSKTPEQAAREKAQKDAARKVREEKEFEERLRQKEKEREEYEKQQIKKLKDFCEKGYNPKILLFLLNEKYELIDLNTINFGPLYLKNNGYSNEQLINIIYDIYECCNKINGCHYYIFLSKYFMANKIREVNISALDLYERGVSLKSLVKARFTTRELLDMGISIRQLLEVGVSIKILLRYVHINTLLQNGITVSDLYREGITIERLRMVGISENEIRNAIITVRSPFLKIYESFAENIEYGNRLAYLFNELNFIEICKFI